VRRPARQAASIRRSLRTALSGVVSTGRPVAAAIVAGVVVVAVGDKLLLAHPEDHLDTMTALVILSGPALFLLGNLLFKNATGRRWPLSHLIGLALLLVPVPWLDALSLIALSGWTVAVMIAVAILERVLLRSREAARVGVN